MNLSRAELFGDDPLEIAARTLDLTEPLPVRRVDALTMTLVESGRLIKVTPERVIPLERGQLVICDSGVAAAHVPLEPTRLVSLYLGQDVLSRLAWMEELPGYRDFAAELYGAPAPELPVVIDLHPALVASIARTMRSVADPAPTSDQPRIFSRLARLMDLMEALQVGLAVRSRPGSEPIVLARTSDIRHGRSVRPEVGHAIRLLQTQPAAPWTIRELARQVHLSPAQLLRSFGRDVGATPMRLLREIRLEVIALLLRTERISFARAVRKVGWSNTHHVRQLFQARWGLSPSQYRANAEQAPASSNRSGVLTVWSRPEP